MTRKQKAKPSPMLHVVSHNDTVKPPVFDRKADAQRAIDTMTHGEGQYSIVSFTIPRGRTKEQFSAEVMAKIAN